MSRGRRTRRSSKGKAKGSVGRLFEGMAVLVLLLIVLTFGASIASRYLPDEDGSRGTKEGLLPLDAPPRPDPRVFELADVEVRNGCGHNGLAKDIGLELRAAGFDVVEWKDANRYDYERTLVVAGGPFRQTGETIRDYFQENYGVGELRVEPGAGGVVDIQVILGADLAKVFDERR